MRILLHSYAFSPSVGGIETIAEQLAENFLALGHECTVVTQTPADYREQADRPYSVVRRPRLSEKLKLIRSHDIVYSNGSSMNLFWWSWLLGKPFVWTHQGYQVTSIDGLGWVNGERAPLRPLQSLVFHIRKSGPIFALLGFLKLLLRKLAASLVTRNVA